MFRKRIRMVLRRRKMPFWNQCRKQYTGNPKNIGPYSGNDLIKNLFWQNTDSLQNDHLYKQKTIFTNVPEVFGKIWKFEASILKNPKKFCFFFEKLIPSKWRSLRVEVSSENRAELSFRRKCVLLCLKSKSQKKSRNFCPNTNFISLCSSVHVEAILTIASKPLLQNSKFLLLRHLKGARSENCSEKTSEWYTEDAKWSFDNSAEKHFAKSQNVFCSKSGNVIKKVSFRNFHSHQNKLLFRYVEGSFDNRAEFSPSKGRNFFWLNSIKDRKCKNFFQRLNFAQNIRLYTKNAVLKKQCQNF